MIFVLFFANILFVLTVCSNAKPMASNGNGVRYVVPNQYVAEESHPYEVFVNPGENSPQLEETDDDSYVDETAPVAVLAVPQNGNGPQVYRIVNSERDLSASASDLDTAASHHGGGGGGGGGHGGWLDMGAYSSGKGAFGWYADYPVGGHGLR